MWEDGTSQLSAALDVDVKAHHFEDLPVLHPKHESV